MYRKSMTIVAAALLMTSTAARAADVVLEWNQIALGATVTAGQGPVPQIRSMTIVQVSMHDAVNAITGDFETYLPRDAAASSLSPVAAAIGAAHRALIRLFPAQAKALDEARAASLAANGFVAGDAAVVYGESVGQSIFDLRANDHSAQAQFPYTAPGAGDLGVWVTTAPTFGPAQLPGWRYVTPWALRAAFQFRPDGPPALDSERYTIDYNEAKYYGVLNNSLRTDEQTRIAQFWLASPSAIWTPILRQVTTARGLNLSAMTRAFALFYLAAADASIACWDAKYTYNFWRPETAIQKGDIDGNALTVGDPGWAPFTPSHLHPEYPSAHSTNSSAMGTILRLLFGNDPGVAFVATSLLAPGFERHWQTFTEGIDEVVSARVYDGLHFRNSDEVGARLGRQVAHFTFTHALQPSRGH
jgi:hypothetical protein